MLYRISCAGKAGIFLPLAMAQYQNDARYIQRSLANRFPGVTARVEFRGSDDPDDWRTHAIALPDVVGAETGDAAASLAARIRGLR